MLLPHSTEDLYKMHRTQNIYNMHQNASKCILCKLLLFEPTNLYQMRLSSLGFLQMTLVQVRNYLYNMSGMGVSKKTKYALLYKMTGRVSTTDGIEPKSELSTK